MADQRTQVVITAKDETATGVNGAIANIGRIGGAYTGLISPITGAVAAITAATAKLAADFKGAIDTGDQLNKLSQKTGIAVEKLSELAYAGDLADVNLESLATGIKKLSVNMAEAATNTNSKAAEAFKALGVTVKDTSGNLRSSDEVMADIADRFADMKDGAGKTALAVALFGKAGADLIPLLNSGGRGLADMADEAKKLGLVMTGETAKAAEEFNDNLRKLTLSSSALGRSIAADLVKPMGDLLAKIIEAKKEGVGLFGSLAIAIRSPDANAPLDELRERAATLQGRISDATAPGGFNIKTRVSADRVELARLQRLIAERLKEANDFGPPVAPADKKEAPAIKGEDSDATKAAKAAADRQATALKRMEEIGRRNLAEGVDSEEEMGKIAARRAIESANAARKEEEATERLRQNYINLADPLQKYRVQLDEINKLRADGKLTAEQAIEAEWQVNDAMDETAKKMLDIKEVGTDAFADLTAAVQGWGKQFTDTLADAVMTGKANFADLANSILRDLVRIQIQKNITDPLVKAGTGFLDDVFKGAFGGPRAGGGDVDPSKFYLVGERGPELFSPGTSGSIIPNEAIGGAGSTVVVNLIENPARGGQTQQRQDGSSNILDVFVSQIRSVVAGDIASGRGPIPAAMESTYGANRAVGAF